MLEYANFHASIDISIQQHTLLNFVNGHGISITNMDENGNLFYKTDSNWAPGLVVMMAPVYLLTENVLLTIILIKIISLVFFVLFLYKYSNFLKISYAHAKIIIIFFAFSVSPFVHFYPADLLATVLCLWGFYYCMLYISNPTYHNLISSITLLALSYFVKFSFLPFLLFVGAAFLLKERYQIFKKSKQLISIILVSMLAFVVVTTINYLLIGPTSQDTSMDAFNGTPHWEHLSRIRGFMYTVGIPLEDFLYERINNYIINRLTFNFVSLIVTLYLYCLFAYNFVRNHIEKVDRPFQQSLSVSFSSSALILIFLAFLSINIPGQTWKKPAWTFVEETRYYGPVIIIGLINALIIMLRKRKLSLIHLVIGAMFCLNIWAYYFTVKYGFNGSNLASYIEAKKIVEGVVYVENEKRIPIVYFDDFTKKSELYHNLQSNGTILRNKSLQRPLNKQRFIQFTLVRDTVNSKQIVRIEKL